MSERLKHPIQHEKRRREVGVSGAITDELGPNAGWDHFRTRKPRVHVR
jgi:hypothetical protein